VTRPKVSLPTVSDARVLYISAVPNYLTRTQRSLVARARLTAHLFFSTILCQPDALRLMALLGQFACEDTQKVQSHSSIMCLLRDLRA